MTTKSHHGLRRAVGRRILGRVVVPGAIIYVVLVGIGLLLAYPLAGIAAVEEGIHRDLASERSPFLTTVTSALSTLANTPAVIGAVIAVAIAMRFIFGRWGESIILVTAVMLQAVVFLLTAMVVDRRRPNVEHLDIAPPTSSFPSGHAGAATALYVGIAVIVAWRLRHRVWRVIVVAALVAIPILVAVSRLYRGMHYPTDVAFGVLNGLACLTVAVRAFLPDILHRGARMGHADSEQVGHFAWTTLFQRRHDASPSSRTARSPSAAGSTSSEN